jgi:hypothetical protein
MIARLPSRLSAWPSPTVVVDLPSPAGVGVIAETSTSGASGRPSRRWIARMWILALSRPYGMKSAGSSPMSRAISSTGRSLASWAIWMSDFMRGAW